MTSIVAGLFESHRVADLVVEHLVQEYGVPRERVRVHARDARQESMIACSWVSDWQITRAQTEEFTSRIAELTSYPLPTLRGCRPIHPEESIDTEVGQKHR